MNVHEARQKGIDYCQTEGSKHYITDSVQPMDLIMALGHTEGFCIGSIIKYASRFNRTRNPEDLKKVADYAHILCGYKLLSGEGV